MKAVTAFLLIGSSLVPRIAFTLADGHVFVVPGELLTADQFAAGYKPGEDEDTTDAGNVSSDDFNAFKESVAASVNALNQFVSGLATQLGEPGIDGTSVVGSIGGGVTGTIVDPNAGLVNPPAPIPAPVVIPPAPAPAPASVPALVAGLVPLIGSAAAIVSE